MELVANQPAERRPRLLGPEPAQDRHVVVCGFAVEENLRTLGEAAYMQQDRSVRQTVLSILPRRSVGVPGTYDESFERETLGFRVS